MALQDKVKELRDAATAQGKDPVPCEYQGVTKERISAVLREIDRYSADQRDAVFALLDDVNDSFYRLQFSSFPAGIKFCEGATVAHVACHFGILQRGQGKSDREGRDYWLKPLWEIGAIVKVYFDTKRGVFIPGHPVAKSPYTAYCLAEDFKLILRAPDGEWRALLADWTKADEIRQRLEFQAKLAEASRSQVDTKHSDLIRASCEHYVPRFLPGYEVLYIDDADGERIRELDRDNFYRAGIEIGLTDSMPDALLWNPDLDWLWVIEAVTSDGEVDHHKMSNLTALAKRCGKKGIGFTTTYQTWNAAARRQGKYKNISPGTYIWIQDDPTKHFLAETFDSK
ncbi:MAG: DUF1317 family protein [Puniceicoccaceae bacterium]|nr:MAG: DUF1317 family protein [Puniceicoccaceae bacterium]